MTQMNLVALSILVFLLGGSLGVLALASWLARKGIPFEVWHGVLGWVIAFGVLGIATHDSLPEVWFLPLLGLALVLSAGATMVFYAARRRRKVAQAAVGLESAMRAQPSEPIAGWFEARQMNFWKADQEYALLVARERLVAVRIGGQFTGATMSHQELRLFGSLFAREVDAFQSERRFALDRVFSSADLDVLSRHHPANFQLAFAQIRGVRIIARSALQNMGWPGPALLQVMRADGPDVKLLLQSRADIARCVALLLPLRPGVSPELL